MTYNKAERTPYISVVIPTYNSEKYIAETLESVLNQTYNDYEIIVSDDGSLDNTIEIVKTIFDKFPYKRTRLLINEHEGPGAARNKGVEAASGEWISFLDSDDKWFPNKLQKVVEFISCNEGIDLICHSMMWQKGSIERLLRSFENFDRQKHPLLSLYREVTLVTSAVTVKKEMLIKAGLFDSTLLASQEYDLWLRLAMIPDFKMGFIDEPIGYYVAREGNISSNIELQLKCMLKIGNKYYKHLKYVCKFPYIEKLRYEGQYYAGSGLKFLRRGNYKKGIIYFVKGICIWPFRFDKLHKKLIKNTKN